MSASTRIWGRDAFHRVRRGPRKQEFGRGGTRPYPFRALVGCLALGVVFFPTSAWACAACFGKSDSSLAVAMNWGIFALLTVIVAVLGGIASFFIYLAKRSASVAAADPPHSLQDPIIKT